jgi:C4-dicarboxylate-specific signal transduction histidine kinase
VESPSAGRVVIVDDEPVLLELLCSLFEGRLDVVACATGAEAVAAMKAGGVDVLLTDKNLPDISGLDLMDRAREVTADAECIIITGFASLDTALVALQRGAFDYIVKPPRSIFDVQRKVEQALQRQAMGRENRRLLAQLKERNAELEAALEAVRRVQSELVQAEKLAGIGTLAAGIAHEISSPLFGVLGLAEAITSEESLPTAREHAAEIVEYAKAIREIVVQLSGYSRSAEREYQGEVEVAKVLADAARLMERSRVMAPGRLVVSAEPELTVVGRGSELQQVVVNLVRNGLEAVEEHRPDGVVRVTARRDGDMVVIEVADDGPGIPADILKDIFDPFFTTKPPGKGTGLGLNIVWRLVTRYGGTVSVASEVGVGTTFTVRLPAAG